MNTAMADQADQPRELTEQVRRHIYRTNGTIPWVFSTGLVWLGLSRVYMPYLDLTCSSS
jgi:hypothetical protein